MLDNVKETGKLLVPTFTGGAMKKLPVDQMVGAFMNLREAIQKREDEIKELKEKQEKIKPFEPLWKGLTTVESREIMT